jgi:hypothetical protein
MLYQLGNYTNFLRDALSDIVEDNTDIVIVTKDGERIKAHKLLLSFHSKYVSDILKTSSVSASLIVPVSSSSMRVLLNILSSGSSDLKNKNQVEAVIDAASLLGIQLEQWEILSESQDDETSNT